MTVLFRDSLAEPPKITAHPQELKGTVSGKPLSNLTVLNFATGNRALLKVPVACGQPTSWRGSIVGSGRTITSQWVRLLGVDTSQH